MKKSFVFLLASIAAVAMMTITLKTEIDKKNHPPTNTDSGYATKDDLIILTTPLVAATVQSPLSIAGKARGSWYFEASFPVELLDANGLSIASGTAQAQGDWMIEEYVPFIANLSFVQPTTETGILILKKDNPSGDPARDNNLSIHVRFTPTGEFNNK